MKHKNAVVLITISTEVYKFKSVSDDRFGAIIVQTAVATSYVLTTDANPPWMLGEIYGIHKQETILHVNQLLRYFSSLLEAAAGSRCRLMLELQTGSRVSRI